MTFSKQLYTLILLTSLLMAGGTLYISIENTRSYLTLQLAAQTQNTADSLGLSLVPYMKNKDIAAMDTMVNAVFDSGYYKSLTLKTMSGSILIARENTSRVENVPEWFTRSLRLPTTEAESVITTGWIQAGKLTLSAHPGFAYKKLWDASKEVIWWSLMVFILTLILSFLLLREILKPLSAVEQQALDICNREFPIVREIPKTRELNRVVLAMNKMSSKMESITTELTRRAERIHKQTDYDELTGLLNSNRFSSALESAIRNVEQAGSGYIAMIRLHHFDNYNKQHGHLAGDKLLGEIAKLLKESCVKLPSANAARISGVDFAMIFPLATSDTVTLFAESLSAKLALLNLKPTSISIGIAPFNEQSNVEEAIKDADVAVTSAQYQGIPNFHILPSGNIAIEQLDWEKLTRELLEHEQIELWSQPIMTPESRLIYSEVLMRIRDTFGTNMSSATFAAIAERMGLHIELDKYVISHVINIIEQLGTSATPMAVNISAGSIRESNFTLWLQQQMKAHQQASAMLLFEITEYAAMQNIENTGYLIDLAHQYHGRIVIEHYGTRPEFFQTLRQLKADYVKLDSSYVKDITENNERRSFLQTIIDIANSLDMGVIIEHIETADDVQNFEALGIKAMQGFYFGKPSPIK